MQKEKIKTIVRGYRGDILIARFCRYRKLIVCISRHQSQAEMGGGRYIAVINHVFILTAFVTLQIIKHNNKSYTTQHNQIQIQIQTWQLLK